MKILKESTENEIIISEPTLQFEISDELNKGTKLEDIISYISTKYPDWKFNRTEDRYYTCIMAIFEPRR